MGPELSPTRLGAPAFDPQLFPLENEMRKANKLWGELTGSLWSANLRLVTWVVTLDPLAQQCTWHRG